jgi:hypothetical protein
VKATPDGFLREIRLECHGHLGAFTINGSDQMRIFRHESGDKAFTRPLPVIYNADTKAHRAMSLICRAALLTFCIASFALCQVERASIAGTLRDSTGLVVPGVVVKVTSEGTNRTATFITNAGARPDELRPGGTTIFGRAGGAVVITSTKSGSNQFSRHHWRYRRGDHLCNRSSLAPDTIRFEVAVLKEIYP